jgi:hypothetical protein
MQTPDQSQVSQSPHSHRSQSQEAEQRVAQGPPPSSLAVAQQIVAGSLKFSMATQEVAVDCHTKCLSKFELTPADFDDRADLDLEDPTDPERSLVENYNGLIHTENYARTVDQLPIQIPVLQPDLVNDFADAENQDKNPAFDALSANISRAASLMLLATGAQAPPAQPQQVPAQPDAPEQLE